MDDLLRIKYPRTLHLPWSNPSSDDKICPDISVFDGQEIVVTEKMDGENTTMYDDYIHARSLEPLAGEARGYAKSLHAAIRHRVPNGWRLCGENLYAKHSVSYAGLPAYFLLFSVWDADNLCLSWDDTARFAQEIGIETVPVLFRGDWNPEVVSRLHQPCRRTGESEGYVVRRAASFPFNDFGNAVAKYVRPNHVTTDRHWRHQKIVPNALCTDDGA